jgi:tyrosine-protein phosphatase non-receptor type 1
VSVQDILLELRKYRMGLIQTYDQLTFSYEAIIEGMRRMNNDVSVHLSRIHESNMILTL